MKNTHGIKFDWNKLSDNEYIFTMEQSKYGYTRLGGKEHQTSIDMQDLGFFDPPGGPFVKVGCNVNTILPPEMADDRTISNIRTASEEEVFLGAILGGGLAMVITVE